MPDLFGLLLTPAVAVAFACGYFSAKKTHHCEDCNCEVE